MKKLIISVIAIIVVLSSVIAYNYFKPNLINLEEIDSSILQGKDLSNPQDLKSIIEETQNKNILPANPRIKVFYQGTEVAYIDHLGNIYGSAGWFTDLNASIINATVFYESGNRLVIYQFSTNNFNGSGNFTTTGQVETSGFTINNNINGTGNVSVVDNSRICLDGSACTKYMFYNGSNIIIQA